MQNAPKIVRERLRSAAPAVNHPDADLLTAFAERSLPEIDRGVVLEHLARCVDCRDIVALSLPATEPLQPLLKPSPSGWLTWPALRWGFVAAGVVAIASFGVLYQRRFQAAPVASQLSPAFKVAANEPVKQPLASFVAPSPDEKTEKLHLPAAPAFADSVNKPAVAADAKTRTARAEAAPAPVVPQAGTAGRPVHGAASFGPRVANNQRQQSNAFQNQAPTPPPPSAYPTRRFDAADQPANPKVPSSSEGGEVSGAAPTFATEAQSVNAPPQASADQAMVARAKAPVHAGNAGAASVLGAVGGAVSQPSPAAAQNLPSNGRNFAKLGVQSPPLQPRWTITAAGGLQRSFDQGSTWQAVEVTASLTSFADTDATSLTTGSAETSSAKVEAKKQKDAHGSVNPAPVLFRAVAAAGSEVWAGGSAGALFHSLDSGNHWTRVVPGVSATMLTGDILSIDFPDPQHFKLSTSTHEAWTTSDDGSTWQKQ